MLSYLLRLTPSRVTLWSYLIWYLVVLWRHFEAVTSLWLNSLAMSVLIGTALYLSTVHSGRVVTLDRWQVFRLYLMPFCVSSYAALIKGRDFVLIFHPTLGDNLLPLALIGALWAVVFAVQRLSGVATGMSAGSR